MKTMNIMDFIQTMYRHAQTHPNCGRDFRQAAYGALCYYQCNHTEEDCSDLIQWWEEHYGEWGC